MKKSLAVILALMLLLSAVFFGCGKKEDENTDSTQSTTETTTESRNQEDVNKLEEDLGKQTLVMITNEILKKGAQGNTLDTAAVRTTVLNGSEKTVTYAVIAFGLWDSEDKPVVVATGSDGKKEYITRYSYMSLSVPSNNMFGGDVLIPLTDEVASKAEYIKAIPVSCTFDDGTNWVNPHYEDFIKMYDGQTFAEGNKGDNTETTGAKEENTTTTKDAGIEGNTTTTRSENSGSSVSGEAQNGGTITTQQSAVKEEYLVNKCIDIFAKGTYKMTVVTDPGTADEASFTMAVKNGNMCMTTTMDEIEATMLYKAGEDKTYMLFNSIKMYTEVTEDMMGGDMDMSELTKEFKLTVPDKVTVSQANFNGKSARCESIVENGEQSNYYFDASGNFIGKEDFNSDGTATRMYVSGFTANVDDSTFEVPKGFHFVNLSWIMAFMGD